MVWPKVLAFMTNLCNSFMNTSRWRHVLGWFAQDFSSQSKSITQYMCECHMNSMASFVTTDLLDLLGTSVSTVQVQVILMLFYCEWFMHHQLIWLCNNCSHSEQRTSGVKLTTACRHQLTHASFFWLPSKDRWIHPSIHLSMHAFFIHACILSSIWLAVLFKKVWFEIESRGDAEWRDLLCGHKSIQVIVGGSLIAELNL